MSHAQAVKFTSTAFRTALLSTFCAVQVFATGTITTATYPVPIPKSLPEGVTLGPDGNVWFTQNAGPEIGRVIPATGVITEFSLPDGANAAPWDIITGPDGALWYTDTNTSVIGRMTTDGVVTNIYPTLTPDSAPRRMTIGQDGAIWFTEYTVNQIGRITVQGEITEFAIPGKNTKPAGIAAGPDNAIWFMENFGNAVVRMSLDGVVTNTYPLPTPSAVAAQIVLGPDGNLWYTENRGNHIGRVVPSTGQITEWEMPTPDAIPGGLIATADGALWFTEWEKSVSQIGRITTDGIITEYPDGTPDSEPWEIGVGPGGTAVWWANWKTDQMATAPICAVGLTASYIPSSSTLTINYNIGTAQDWTWRTWVKENGVTVKVLYSADLPAQLPLLKTSSTYTFPSNGGMIAIYSGLFDSTNAPVCTENVSVSTVAQGQTTTALASSPNPSKSNQSVLLTATVSPSTATGSVTFYHGSTVIATSNLSSGVATTSISTLSSGVHEITAVYNGDLSDAPSTSSVLDQIVK